jgi:hypothetical protein
MHSDQWQVLLQLLAWLVFHHLVTRPRLPKPVACVVTEATTGSRYASERRCATSV